MNIIFENIPKEVRAVALTLEAAGFEAFLVGGAVRDLVMGKIPVDYDIATNAHPDQIIALFPKTFYENVYGTVGVVTTLQEASQNETSEAQVVEVTPYRQESVYTDGRHPDTVSFSSSIHDDLMRRDFTINALAYRLQTNELLDEYRGLEDITQKVIRAVGNPQERFREDSLRLLRAVRFASVLDFGIESRTEEAIIQLAPTLERVSFERIRDEFFKIIMGDNPKYGIELLYRYKLLSIIMPELIEGIGVSQNQAHSYDVWEHNLRTLEHAAQKKWPLHVRIAALLHDVSKPTTRRFSQEKNDYTFYGHEVVGAKTAKRILDRLKCSHELRDKVVNLVRWHMFFSDTEQITLSAVRRMIRNVGEESIWDLMNLRICDRVGTGRPKEEPYRFRKYQSMIDEALRDPISPKMLKIDGDRLMKILSVPPSPILGKILKALMEEVLDEPSKNTEEYLETRAIELSKMSEEELNSLASAGEQKVKEVEGTEVQKIRRKFHVK